MTSMKKTCAWIIAACLLSYAPHAFPQELTPKEIVKRCDDLMRGDT